jgi:hypothetical protein
MSMDLGLDYSLAERMDLAGSLGITYFQSGDGKLIHLVQWLRPESLVECIDLAAVFDEKVSGSFADRFHSAGTTFCRYAQTRF